MTNLDVNDATTSRPETAIEDLVRPALVVCSLGAAAIHLATAGEHALLFGVAFLLMAGFQGAWALAVILSRSRLVLLGGVLGQGAIVATWLAAHTSGLPFGPGVGQPEATGFKDITATVLELIAIGGALLLLRPDVARRLRDSTAPRSGVPFSLAAAAFLTTAAILTPHAHGPGAHGHGVTAHGDDHGDEDEAAHDDGTEHQDGAGHDDGADHDGQGDSSTPHGHDVALGDGGSGTDHDGHGDGGHGDGGGHGGGGHGGGGNGGGGDPGPGTGEPAQVVAGPFAEATGYTEPTIEVDVGGRLSFSNFDVVAHDVVHDVAADGFGGSADMPWCGGTHHAEGPCPVFWSPSIGSGETTLVLGLNNVQAGHAYAFFCTLHHSMRGTLIVR